MYDVACKRNLGDERRFKAVEEPHHEHYINNDLLDHGNMHHGDRATQVADRWRRDRFLWLLADVPASSVASN